MTLDLPSCMVLGKVNTAMAKELKIDFGHFLEVCLQERKRVEEGWGGPFQPVCPRPPLPGPLTHQHCSCTPNLPGPEGEETPGTLWGGAGTPNPEGILCHQGTAGQPSVMN